MRYFFFFFCSVLALGVLTFLGIPKTPKFTFDPISLNQEPSKNSKETYRSDIPMPPDAASAHSSTITPIRDNSLLVAFFAGSREGAADVAIYGSILESAYSKKWQQPFKILDRFMLMQDSREYIAKLGNPVLYTLGDTLHLFVVGVSIGGWATSKIYHYSADNKGAIPTFVFQKALHLSPFLNISNLVRTRPVEITLSTQEKGFILPIYHELATKYPINLVFDARGNLLMTSQPNHLNGLLQPSLTSISQTSCMLAYRANKKAKNILYTQTCDNNLKYGPLTPTNLKNYDNSLNLFALNKQVYLLHNTPLHNSNRGKLTLSKMQSPEVFEKLFDIDSTPTQKGEVSYPTAWMDPHGILHVTYTFDRKFIRYVRIDMDALEGAR
ncbi:BNR/Asp-box repeat-containing protein [Helicobacter mustelae]|nr:BNR/Asp-box repeat-containing protein [Helicobacter mustelae]